MLTYPDIDPVIVSIGPLAIRWYGLMYVFGFGVAWWLARKRSADPRSTWQPQDIDDLIFYSALGVILGGRLGWVLFYGFERLSDDPWMLIRIWEGGMSFHGGMLGVVIAATVLAWRQKRHPADIFDFLTPLPCIGIFAGRVANFINGELWGKPTQSALGFIVDPSGLHPVQTAEAKRLCTRFGIDPCVLHVHASQLYEGVLEGLVLFAIMWTFTAKPRPRLAPAGLFLVCYGIFRFVVEFVRVPDESRGYLLFGWVTMGQILSAPMILVGAYLMILAYRRRTPSGNWQAMVLPSQQPSN
jgi:phosphatidylglycerol:prolipoprotein diacylglycerol transferase